MGPGGAAVNIFSSTPSEGIKLLHRFYEGEPSRERLEDFIRIMVFDQSLITDELIDERFAIARDPEVLAGSARAIESFSRPGEDDQLWRSLHKIKHEVLMTWGRDDRVLPLDGAFFALRRIPNARLHVFPKCGHWAQVERRVEFDELALSFLSS
jgi:pimeloyl-ACP methyl ester carboxylesterase